MGSVFNRAKAGRMKPFTLSDIKASKVAHLNEHITGEVKKKSKYRNTRTEIDGIKFDSSREAKRYGELKLLLKAGEIGLLELQKEYELNEGGTHSLKYLADFVYMDARTGETIVEDAKGALTEVYKKKRRLMKQVYGITIHES